MTQDKFELGKTLMEVEVEQQELLLAEQRLKLAAIKFAENPKPNNQVELLKLAAVFGELFFENIENQLSDSDE